MMIGFIFAMNKEAQPFLEKLNNVRKQAETNKEIYTANFLTKKCVIIVCGVGKVNAAMATQHLIDVYSPSLIINAGVCGGLESSMNILDIYTVSSAIEFDFDLSHIDNVPVGKLEDFDTPNIEIINDLKLSYPTGVLASGDHFYYKEANENIFTELGATLKDMEGAAVAHVAKLNNSPLLIVKSLSDVVGGKFISQYQENVRKASASLASALIKILTNHVKV